MRLIEPAARTPFWRDPVTDGDDLRYYEDVLLHVNQEQERSGITGTYQDPGVLGGGRMLRRRRVHA